MNKQKLIEEIKKEKYDFSKPETSLDSSDYKEGYNDASDDILDIIKQLDEPQKVKVPSFVADYIKRCRDRKWELVSMALPSNAEYVESHSESSGLHEWINENYATFLIAIATDDYEVEEKPKWVVIGKQGYLTSLKIGKGEAKGWTGNSDKFTSGAIHFEDKEQAEAVALLVSGEIEKV